MKGVWGSHSPKNKIKNRLISYISVQQSSRNLEEFFEILIFVSSQIWQKLPIDDQILATS